MKPRTVKWLWLMGRAMLIKKGDGSVRRGAPHATTAIQRFIYSTLRADVSWECNGYS